MFEISGKKSVLAALRSKRKYDFQELMIASHLVDADFGRTIASLANKRKAQIKKLDRKHMDSVAGGFFNHQGVILKLNGSPERVEINDLIFESKSDQAQASGMKLLALDCITDHTNIGAITRTAACFGIRAIVAARDRSAPLIHPAVWKISQGAAEDIDFCEASNLANVFNKLKDADFWIIGADSGSDAQDIRKMGDWPKKICIVLGSESQGMRQLTRKLCDMLVRIPIRESQNIDSLNVSHAASVILWEANRKQ
ncbi:23S rRNA (guanosine(2251)-2'-O)-methyltransferase RlmB [Elusimicrobiota bacterium]